MDRAAPPRPTAPKPTAGEPAGPFASPLLLAFDTACQRGRDGAWSDLAAVTGHDRFATPDYARVAGLGVRAVREGARWPIVERRPWQYDFRALAPSVAAARAHGIGIVWTLLEGGWPADLDPMRPLFVRRFAAFAAALARFLRDESDGAAPWIVPVDQLGHRAWLGGELGHAPPYLQERGFELQAQLVRAAVAAADSFRLVLPGARVMSAEPLVNVAAHPDRPGDADDALAAAARRHHATDMLTGCSWPQLGGEARQVDVVGVTYHPGSQWYYGGPQHPGPPITPGAPGWRPLRELLVDTAERYRKPVCIAATGRDGSLASAWLRYVCGEAHRAALGGATIAGVVLEPALGCSPLPGRRRASQGVWGAANASGYREVDAALADQVTLQCASFSRARSGPLPAGDESVALRTGA
jgi:hypothetical protein